MKKSAAFAAFIVGIFICHGQEVDSVKKIRFFQDDAQKPFVSKVYELKHVSANDITPFVLGAVNRYNTNSKVDRLRYAFGKKEYLVVTTPPAMMPYIDDMVAKIDRPTEKRDPLGSPIAGTGIYRFSYMPKHRANPEVVDMANDMLRSGDGYVFFNSALNMIYWKDSYSDGKHVENWIKAFDRPVPQVELSFRIYEVRDSVLNDIGVDYLAWKNGPGLNMLSVGMETLALNTVEEAFSNMSQFSSYAFGGFFVAPQFDMSFIRMLSQKGAAQIVTKADLTIVNNYAGSYHVSMSPELQNIAKDSNDRTAVNIGAAQACKVTVTNPVICFKRTGEVSTVYDGRIYDMTEYGRLCGTVQFRYKVETSDVLERNNRGTELTETSTIESALSFSLCSEYLLAVVQKDQEVEQVIGVPFLSDIPILKYLFSTTTTINESSKLFVTVRGRLVHPEDQYAEWTGQLISPTEICKP